MGGHLDLDTGSQSLGIILAVWITCILYSSPKFYWGNTVTVTTENSSETVCVLNRQKFNSKMFDIIHFALLYLIPLAIISNSNGNENLLHNSANGNVQNTNLTQNVLKARRGVIKMLIIVVCAFALCNLPFHARKMWQYWSPNYQGHTNFSALLTPLTFLSTYFNSGVNPLLYAFLSKNFRRGMRELLLCSHKKRHGKRTLIMNHNRGSTRSTTLRQNNSLTTTVYQA
ncbi:unnamed protein product [Ceutorhynchus assimilis]|uniref:G-protein coupled receptors family 1 profile domain-containing protein n=1 Tax=Ceutorhynchus assimilis TaxID=467358 RepID=A0A9N9MV51_9CUCU|nr:unnamed protein product [Ceutorhynchus assimilis]